MMWGNFTLREKALLLVLVLLLIAGVLWKIAPQLVGPAASEDRSGKLIEESTPYLSADHPEPEPEMIIVHLVGAVQCPGVYHLPVGSRVYDLVEAGGGPAEEADLEAINLARPLYDGEQVAIYRPGEAAAVNPAAPAAAGQKVNINKASAEELQTLPSIGEVRAQRIVEHREKHGPFTAVEEIMDVSGIGTGIFNQIKERITIY